MLREEEDDTEAHLRDAEMRFARFFNNAPIGVATLDKDGVLGSSNSAFVTLVGGTPEAGSRFADLGRGASARRRAGGIYPSRP